MQAIKYKWDLGAKEPFLFFDNSEKRTMIGPIAMDVGARTCIGHFRDGRHVRCPDRRAIENSYYCNRCRLNDDFFLCVQCDGSTCANGKQRLSCDTNNYIIYLAAFDSLLKIGISHEMRILERLVEQGADFAAKIARVQGGKSVRMIEQSISKELGIVDRVRGADKQSKIFGSPNTAMANISFAIKKLQANGIAQHLIQPEIFDLRSYYRLHNVHFAPTKLAVRDGLRIEGEVVAAKGNVLVIKNNGNYLSINAHDLIGREIISSL